MGATWQDIKGLVAYDLQYGGSNINVGPEKAAFGQASGSEVRLPLRCPGSISLLGKKGCSIMNTAVSKSWDGKNTSMRLGSLGVQVDRVNCQSLLTVVVI